MCTATRAQAAGKAGYQSLVHALRGLVGHVCERLLLLLQALLDLLALLAALIGPRREGGLSEHRAHVRPRSM